MRGRCPFCFPHSFDFFVYLPTDTKQQDPRPFDWSSKVTVLLIINGFWKGFLIYQASDLHRNA